MKVSRWPLVLVAVLTLTTLGAPLALAADTVPGLPSAVVSPPSPVQDILTSIMQLVALVLAGLVAWAVKLLAAKFKLTISAEQEELVRKVARDSVFYAEEWTAKKFGAADVAGQGAQKLLTATEFMLQKLPGLDLVAAQDAIHAILGSIQGLGASKAVGAKA